MSERLDIKDKLRFNADELVSPDATIAEIGNQLESITNGLVKGIVKSYDGPIESYYTSDFSDGISSLAAKLITPISPKYDIQNDLGEIGYKPSKYEFYLVSSKYPNYKFRIMFFEYELDVYPVKIILEQGLADAIFEKEGANYILEIPTKNDLEDRVINILKSPRAIKVIQGLINVSLTSQEGSELPAQTNCE